MERIVIATHITERGMPHFMVDDGNRAADGTKILIANRIGILVTTLSGPDPNVTTFLPTITQECGIFSVCHTYHPLSGVQYTTDAG